MDTKENIETAETGERKSRIDWSKWDAIFSVAIVAFIIFVPLGGIGYLEGRSISYPIFSYACLIYLTTATLIIVYVVLSSIHLLRHRKRYMRRKRLIKILQIGILVAFFSSFAISVLTPMI